jgi:glucose-1-phosphate adenylyltransferase
MHFHHRLRETIQAADPECALLMNAQNMPYGDLYWLECSYFRPDAPWRETVEFCYEAEIHHAPERPMLPLYWHDEPRYLASMGIYTFRPHVLADTLADPSRMDFGREVIPAALGSYRVLAHPFAGHWEDIGTIRSFFDAHMKLLAPHPSFRLYQPGWPIFTHQRNLPPARVMDSTVRNSLLAEGADVNGATITESVIGVRSVIRPGAVLHQVVMQGADYYEGEEPMHHLEAPLPGAVPMGIGENCRLSRVILDKNCRIGAGTVIEPKPNDAEFEGPNYWVREGITVIPKGAVLEPGTRI